MSKAALVADVEMLVAKWGEADVRKAIEFVLSFPADGVITAHDYDGVAHMLTKAQHSDLYVIYRENGKISAIKKLREYDGMGLRDAKAVIEFLFEPERYTQNR